MMSSLFAINHYIQGTLNRDLAIGYIDIEFAILLIITYVSTSYLTRHYMIINQNGAIPFMAAYGGGHISLAGLLIKANADVNRTDAVRFCQQRCGNETFCAMM